ncbi:TPA: hypothetical protein ACX6QD_002947 [Photobacterium damselae]
MKYRGYEKARRREGEKGEKWVFRKIREKLEQILVLGEILGIREDEMARRGKAVFRKIRGKPDHIFALGKILGRREEALDVFLTSIAYSYLLMYR